MWYNKRSMAGGITESIIEEIKTRVDLADLIASYGVQIRRSGGSLKACCPFHHEKTPSFTINTNRGLYHCFGCGESGDAIGFVMKMEGLSFPEATKKLASQVGVVLEEKDDPERGLRKRLYALMNELAQFYHRCLTKMKEAETARAYLLSRDLDEKTQEDFVIGYAPNGIRPILKWGEKYGFTPKELEAAGVIKAPTRAGDLGYHRFGGRLMFTIKDKQGRVVAFSGRQLVEKKNSGKYVNSPETPIFKKSKVLFGFDRAAGNIVRAPHREVICCEGQIDTIRLHLKGFTTAVASQGTAFTEEHARMIKRVADAAVLMYDDDAAGHKATVKVAALLLAHEMPVRVVSLPDGDDPDSFLRKHAADELKALIDKAESIVSFQCRVERALEKNPNSIDAVSRVSRAVLTTLAACPSAILRASLTDEAARILGLPVAALAEELKRVKAAPPPPPENDTEEPEPSGEDVVEPPPQAVPPPERELALAAFLMANEYDKTLDGMVGDFLPPRVLAHAFTRRFLSVWREETAKGEDLFAAFAETLPEPESEWFGRVLLESSRTGKSELSPTDILQGFIRGIWCDKLRQIRGDLPARGDSETDARRLGLSMDIKRFQQARWPAVKDKIKDLLARKEIE